MEEIIKEKKRYKIVYDNNQWCAVMATNEEILTSFRKKDVEGKYKNIRGKDVLVDFGKVLYIIETDR